MLNLQHRGIHHNHQHTPWHQLWRQPLAALIRMPWPLFFVAMAATYIAEILIFSIILSFDAEHLSGNAPMGLPKPVAFAVETFFASGLSDLAPDSLFTYSIALLDFIAGLITLSTLTAVVFSKLSSNEMPLIFSRHICISDPKEGHLFCRFVTSDRSQWLNTNYSLTLIYDDEIEPGLWQRRIVPLETINSGTPQLSQSATIIHAIDSSSPLTQLGLKTLQQRNGVIMPLVEGVDETTGSSLLQTHLYNINQIMCGYRYDDIVSTDKKGRKTIDIRRLNNVVALTPET